MVDFGAIGIDKSGWTYESPVRDITNELSRPRLQCSEQLGAGENRNI